MKRESILIILGVIILLAPFSGLPQAWLEFLLPALGLFVGGVGFSLRSRNKHLILVPQNNIPETSALLGANS